MKSIHISPHGRTLLVLGSALCMITTGLFTSTALINAMLDRRIIAPDSPDKRYLVLAADMEKKGYPRSAFLNYGKAIDAARTRTQRAGNVIEMVNFLLRDGEWRPARERLKMAEAYILGIMTQHLGDPVLNEKLADAALKTAALMHNRELFNGAMAVITRLAPDGTESFSLHAAEFDALFAIGDQADTYGGLTALENIARNENERLEMLYRRAKVLWRALTDNAWLNAGGTRFPGNSDAEKRAAILHNLEIDADVLSKCDVGHLTLVAMILKAKLAVRRNAPDDAILILTDTFENKNMPQRERAGELLLDILNRKGDYEKGDKLRLVMLKDASMRRIALADLEKQLTHATDILRQKILLQMLDDHLLLLDQRKASSANMRLHAAEIALEQKAPDQAARFLKTDVEEEIPRSWHAKRLMLLAEIAEQQGDVTSRTQYLQTLCSQFTDIAPLAADAQYALIDTLVANPASSSPLLEVVVAAMLRFPNDPRNLKGVMTVARKLEETGLYQVAGKYYQHALLFGSSQVQISAEIQKVLAEASLGQARIQLSTGNKVEANLILRTINKQSKWSSIWPESGPLWVTIALEEKQYVEAVRRWRQTCGPPGGALLPLLFGTLVPDAASIQLYPPNTSRTAPPMPPARLMEAALTAAIDKLLEARAFDEIDRIIEIAAADPVWRERLPLDAIRIKTLTRIIAQEPADRAIRWMNRQAVIGQTDLPSGKLLTIDDLRAKMQKTEDASMRVKTTVL